MKITFLCKRYFTGKDLFQEKFGRYFFLPQELAEIGFQVQVLALDTRLNSSEKMVHRGVTYQSVPLNFRSLSRTQRDLNKLVREFSTEVIIAGGHTYVGCVGEWLARRANIPWIYDVTDFYPAHGWHWIPGARAIFHRSLRVSSGVIAMSDTLNKYVKEFQPRVITLTTGVDEAFRVKYEVKKVRGELQWSPDAKIIGYFGSLEQRTGIEYLLEAFRSIRSTIPSARLVVAGSGAKEKVVHGADVNYLGVLPFSDVPKYMSACDVLVIPYVDVAHNRYAGPCKVAEYLAAQRPTVVTDVGNYASFFASSPSSICAPADSSQLAEAILGQIRNPVVCPFLPDLEWSSLANKLKDFLYALKNRDLPV